MGIVSFNVDEKEARNFGVTACVLFELRKLAEENHAPCFEKRALEECLNKFIEFRKWSNK